MNILRDLRRTEEESRGRRARWDRRENKEERGRARARLLDLSIVRVPPGSCFTSVVLITTVNRNGLHFKSRRGQCFAKAIVPQAKRRQPRRVVDN